jgi:hypothetical protein
MMDAAVFQIVVDGAISAGWHPCRRAGKRWTNRVSAFNHR